jgi:hypothetical protein
MVVPSLHAWDASKSEAASACIKTNSDLFDAEVSYFQALAAPFLRLVS